MICLECGELTDVIETRRVGGGKIMRRRRQCLGCKGRFTTLEVRTPDGQMLKQGIPESLDAIAQDPELLERLLRAEKTLELIRHVLKEPEVEEDPEGKAAKPLWP